MPRGEENAEVAKAARRKEIEASVAKAKAKQAAEAVEAAKAAAAAGDGFAPLSKQQVVEKLDNIPVFTVTTVHRQLMGVPDEAGDTCCRWYADVDEAQSALILTQHLHPDTPLVLGVTPLGTAYALAHGWQQSSSAHPLRLHPSKAVVADLADELGAAAAAEGEEVFPLFCCDELSSARLAPMFLTKADLAATWSSIGRPAASLPKDLQVASLQGVVRRMLSDTTFDWRSLVLVASEKATAMAHSIQTRPQPGGPEDEPPPLE